MHDKTDTPIYSARDSDSEARDEISDFVIDLAERVDLLQDAEGGEDLEPLRLLADTLASDAKRLGFDLLAAGATRVAEACVELKPDVAEDAMVELTDIARRVRLGHRGAA